MNTLSDQHLNAALRFSTTSLQADIGQLTNAMRVQESQ